MHLDMRKDMHLDMRKDMQTSLTKFQALRNGAVL